MSESISDDGVMEWVLHFGAGQTKKKLIALIAVVAGALLGFVLLRGIFGAILGAGVIFFSALELFLPIRYRIDKQGARVRLGISTTAIDWADVKRIWWTGEGYRLSPLENESRLDAFRGVHLRSSGNAEQILAKITEFAKDARLLDRRPNQGGGGSLDQQDRGGDQKEKA